MDEPTAQRPPWPLDVLVTVGGIETRTRDLLRSFFDPNDFLGIYLDIAKITEIMRASAKESFMAKADYSESHPDYRWQLVDVAEETQKATLALAPFQLQIRKSYRDNVPCIIKAVNEELQSALKCRVGPTRSERAAPRQLQRAAPIKRIKTGAATASGDSPAGARLEVDDIESNPIAGPKTGLERQKPPLEAVAKDEERRENAKHNLERALQSYINKLDNANARDSNRETEIFCDYARENYASRAAACLEGMPPMAPEDLFEFGDLSERRDLSGLPTIGDVFDLVNRVKVRRPEHWPDPIAYHPDDSLEMRNALRDLTRREHESFKWLLDEPSDAWFRPQIRDCVNECVRSKREEYQLRLAAPPPKDRASGNPALVPNDAKRRPNGPERSVQADATEASPADGKLGKPDGTPEVLRTSGRRGRRPNLQRRDAINIAIGKYGDAWRDHLSEIVDELDNNGVHLGDFHGTKIDLGDGSSTAASRWEHLDLAQGDERKKIIDALRKYSGPRN